MRKKYCVIGGSGFIGSVFVLSSSNQKELQVLDKQENKLLTCPWIDCDIRDKESLNNKLQGFDYVINLAAEHRDDVSPASLYYDVNVQGTRNILDAMDKNGIKKILFTSSVAVFGLNKENPTEDHPSDPFNHYGKSKWQAEEILREWYNKNPKDRKLTIIRPTVVFGENNRGNVFNLLKQIASGKFMMVGNGKNKKSMAYVGNIASFLEYCVINMKGYQVYNYIDKPDMNMNELVSQVETSLNKKIPATRLPKWLGILGGYIFDALGFVTKKQYSVSSVKVKKFCATTQFDATKAHSSGFKVPYTLAKGLDITLKHEFKNGE